MQEQLPYRIYGGLRFFERQEIKDALAYLRLVNNRGDDASFERVVNTPTRGIGDRTLGLVREAARDRGINMWQAAWQLCEESVLAGRAATAVRNFLALMNQLVITSYSIHYTKLYEMAKLYPESMQPCQSLRLFFV